MRLRCAFSFLARAALFPDMAVLGSGDSVAAGRCGVDNGSRLGFHNRGGRGEAPKTWGKERIANMPYHPCRASLRRGSDVQRPFSAAMPDADQRLGLTPAAGQPSETTGNGSGDGLGQKCMRPRRKQKGGVDGWAGGHTSGRRFKDCAADS